MQTVTFQCGHCRNLMAVGIENLGRQVRCPHCQQVVLAPSQPATAPAPAPAPAPDPAPVFTPRSDHEDIFSAEPEDALFGHEDVPQMELPPQPSPMVNGAEAAPPEPVPEPAPQQQFPSLAELQAAAQQESNPYAPPEPAPEPAAAPQHFPSLSELLASAPQETTAAAPPEPAPADPEATLPLGSGEAVPSWMAESSEPASQVTTVTTETAPVEEVAAAPMPRRVRREGNRWFIPLVFLPLVLYAIGATIFVAWALVRFQEAQNEMRDPFEELPDDGDDNGVKKGAKRVTLNYRPEDITRPIPAARRVKLGNTLRVGSVEVTPLRVTRERVAVYVRGFKKATECMRDSLVLHMRLKNVSTDERFAPLDTFFDRQGSVQPWSLPLTHLEVAGHRFSGPARWVSARNTSGDQPQWIKGRDYSYPDGIGPGEEYKLLDHKGERTRDPFICTDGNNREAMEVLFGEDEDGKQIGNPHQGPFLWRVQLRRGVVVRRGKDRSATTVIGVEFNRSDIKRGNG
jgi:hypothetical protein